MCHEYEAWWWRSEAAPKKKVAEPKPRDFAIPEVKPAERARAGSEARKDAKELVPAE